MSQVTYTILYILLHNKERHQPFWSDPLNPIFCLSLIFLAGTLRSLPVQVRLLLVLAAAGRTPTPSPLQITVDPPGLDPGIAQSRTQLKRLSSSSSSRAKYAQDADSPIWIPDRLIHHVTAPQAPGSLFASTTKKEGASSTSTSSANMGRPTVLETTDTREPG